MEVLAFVLLWPLLFFSIGFVFIAFSDATPLHFFSPGFLLWPLIIIGLIALSKRTKGDDRANAQNLDQLRRSVVVFSISLLIPIFIRYIFLAADEALWAIIFGLIIGFSLVIAGMFTSGNRVISRANIFGGALTLLYVYSQLWSLGQGARIVAAGAGLLIAVVISIFKLKDKLV